MYHLADDVLPEILKGAFEIAVKDQGTPAPYEHS
jgi:hypothetical protein